MKQDIRERLRDLDLPNKKLETGHRAEFLVKLQASKRSNSKGKNYGFILKIAAAIVLFVSVGYLTLESFNNKEIIIVETAIEKQLKDIELQYLEHINTEWQNFIALATDENLIKRYAEKLKDLDTDYQEIIIKFKQSKNNILIIESLVKNLQTRLQLLRDIQEHINLLNQKNVQHETITI